MRSRLRGRGSLKRRAERGVYQQYAYSTPTVRLQYAHSCDTGPRVDAAEMRIHCHIERERLIVTGI